MKYSGHRKLLCEFSKLSKSNAFVFLGYQTNTDASILVKKFRPERTGFKMYAEYTRLQLIFLALVPWSFHGTVVNRKFQSENEGSRGINKILPVAHSINS